MGWGFNLATPSNSDYPEWYDNSALFHYIKSPTDVETIYSTFKQIDHWPLFMTGWGRYPLGQVLPDSWNLVDPSVPSWIMDLYSDSLGSKTAKDHRDQLLCEAIPALSLPAGANPVGLFSRNGRENKNFNIPLLFVDPNHWPRGFNKKLALPTWFHSDMHDVAYVYTYGFYDKLVSIISQ